MCFEVASLMAVAKQSENFNTTYYIALLALIFLAYFTSSIALASTVSSPQSIHIFQVSNNQTSNNQTQVIRINATLEILTCNGESLLEGSIKPYVRVTNSSGQVVFEGYCSSCSLSNIEVGEYRIRVSWRDMVVAETLLTFDQNTTSLELRTNTTKVTVNVLNDNGGRIEENVTAKLTIGRKSFTFSPGDTHILPLGEYNVVITYNWLGIIDVKVEDKITVSCSSSLVSFNLPVASRLTIFFKKNDGSSAKGIKGKAYLLSSEEKTIRVVDFRQKDYIRLTNVPYGEYTLRVYFGNKQILSKTINLGENSQREITVSLPIFSSITLYFKTLDNEPLANVELSMKQIDGEEIKFSTDDSGRAVLSNLLEGKYTFTLKWYSLDINVEQNIGSESLTIIFPLKNIDLVIYPKTSSSLPAGLDVKVIIRSNRVLVKEEKLSIDKPKWTIRLENIYTKTSYVVEIEYGEFSWSFTLFNPSKSVNEIVVPFYDVVLIVNDLRNTLLSGCSAVISYGNKKFNYTINNGRVYLEHLPETDIGLIILCGGTSVFKGKIPASALSKREYKVKANVADFKIHISGWFARPLSNARVNLTVTFEGKKLLFSGTTDAFGNVVFKRIPCPPGSSILATIKYGGIVSKVAIDSSQKNVNVFLDVLIDAPFIKLGLVQSITLFVILSIILAAFLLLYRRYKYVRDIESMFEYENIFEEELEEKKHGMLERIKDFLRELRGEKEEEEEEGWDMFG